ncbi:MAG: prepilin-type N-terminal cleavage/methylation domain-containing protein [Firmicutes bacterium]|nr:prepilin-type N-terminal cleavage/methylation domain-containing protein [Bacillota bacterium]
MFYLLEAKRDENGLSLVELVIYMAMLAVIIGGAYVIYDGAETIYSSSGGQADAQRSGRLAQMLMTKDLRMTESFITANDYEVDIRADLDDDNIWEEVKYYVEQDAAGIYRLYRQEDGGSPKELAFGVRNVALSQPLFIYYDQYGMAMTTDTASRKTKTCKMGINLIIDTDTNRPPGAFTLYTKATLRNSQ